MPSVFTRHNMISYSGYYFCSISKSVMYINYEQGFNISFKIVNSCISNLIFKNTYFLSSLGFTIKYKEEKCNDVSVHHLKLIIVMIIKDFSFDFSPSG